jgi:hypothetical protein
VHGETYEDYSHGLRLVWPDAFLDGAAIPLRELMDDPVWGLELTNEANLDVESASWGTSTSAPDCSLVNGG